jgi:hypothetical protein
MKRLIMILALCVPLMAQQVEVNEKDGKTEVTIKKQHDRGDWDRGDRRQMAVKRQKMAKKQKIRQVVRLAVIGGLAYYIGYHEGEKHFKGGMKRRPGMGMGNKK